MHISSAHVTRLINRLRTLVDAANDEYLIGEHSAVGRAAQYETYQAVIMTLDMLQQRIDEITTDAAEEDLLRRAADAY